MTDPSNKRMVILWAALLALVAGSLPLVESTTAAGLSVKDVMRFAADMAQRGNWREAKFRWESLMRDEKEQDNPRLLNNLAVAHEALGDPEQARDYYNQAYSRGADEPAIEENRFRSARFWKHALVDDDDDPARPGPPPDKAKKKGRTIRVPVGLPVPPRLELEGNEALLVASFLNLDTNLLDTNRELVRFLRSEFRKETGLEVLSVVPPPAVPEQRIDDLIANHEFWRHLARNYGADLIVSGAVTYDREDASTFRDVDIVSNRTGQKVRESRFVEQEQFVYMLDIFFIDGATGELLFRDRLQRSVIFTGTENDPITAFYELSESLSADIMAVVTQRVRTDTRIIFRR